MAKTFRNCKRGKKKCIFYKTSIKETHYKKTNQPQAHRSYHLHTERNGFQAIL